MITFFLLPISKQPSNAQASIPEIETNPKNTSTRLEPPPLLAFSKIEEKVNAFLTSRMHELSLSLQWLDISIIKDNLFIDEKQNFDYEDVTKKSHKSFLIEKKFNCDIQFDLKTENTMRKLKVISKIDTEILRLRSVFLGKRAADDKIKALESLKNDIKLASSCTTLNMVMMNWFKTKPENSSKTHQEILKEQRISPFNNKKTKDQIFIDDLLSNHEISDYRLNLMFELILRKIFSVLAKKDLIDLYPVVRDAASGGFLSILRGIHEYIEKSAGNPQSIAFLTEFDFENPAHLITISKRLDTILLKIEEEKKNEKEKKYDFKSLADLSTFSSKPSGKQETHTLTNGKFGVNL